jgi:protein-S-isoprenylcysteine O-methyltransferase Ste14
MDLLAVKTRNHLWTAGFLLGVATQIVFGLTVWQLFWFLQSSATHPSGHWLLNDLVLALQFAMMHSLLLFPSVRNQITRRVPAGLYGCFFCAVTCAGLWLIFARWRTAPVIIWQIHGLAAAAITAAFYASWIILALTLRLSGFGYQTGWTQWRYWLRGQPLPNRGLVDRGVYRWMRHPVYFSFLGLIWFTPRMTLDHALLTAAWTAYVFAGSVLKDRRLAFYLGDSYREYASRVAGYPGMFWGPLAKWPRQPKGASHTTEPSNRLKAA